MKQIFTLGCIGSIFIMNTQYGPLIFIACLLGFIVVRVAETDAK